VQACFECGDEATFQHHVVPESLGGTKTVPLCGVCHPKAHGENGHWKTSELIKEKFKQKKEAGLWPCGQVPFGKRLGEDGRLHDDEVQARWVKWIIEKNKSGWTGRRIAKELMELEVKTATGASTWTSYSVCRVIRYNTGAAPVNWRYRATRGLAPDPRQVRRLKKSAGLSEGS
jgi:hypothetical protein